MRNPQALHKEADRARFYAHLIGDEEAASRLRQYAAELDAMAEAAEPVTGEAGNPQGQELTLTPGPPARG